MKVNTGWCNGGWESTPNPLIGSRRVVFDFIERCDLDTIAAMEWKQSSCCDLMDSSLSRGASCIAPLHATQSCTHSDTGLHSFLLPRPLRATCYMLTTCIFMSIESNTLQGVGRVSERDARITQVVTQRRWETQAAKSNGGRGKDSPPRKSLLMNISYYLIYCNSEYSSLSRGWHKFSRWEAQGLPLLCNCWINHLIRV